MYAFMLVLGAVLFVSAFVTTFWIDCKNSPRFLHNNNVRWIAAVAIAGSVGAMLLFISMCYFFELIRK